MDFADVLDKKLDTPNDPCPEFVDAMESLGTKNVFELLDKIDYPRKKEAKDAIIKYEVEAFFKASEKPTPLEYIFGLRKPGSERLTWNGAYVVCKAANNWEITAAIFENGMDYIGHPKTYREAMVAYNSMLKEGWLPMDREDLEKVSGTAKDIVKTTFTTPEAYEASRNKKMLMYLGIGAVVAAIAVYVQLQP